MATANSPSLGLHNVTAELASAAKSGQDIQYLGQEICPKKKIGASLGCTVPELPKRSGVYWGNP